MQESQAASCAVEEFCSVSCIASTPLLLMAKPTASGQASGPRSNPTRLVLDTPVRVHAIDENGAGQVAAVLAYLRSAERQTGAAIALAHHVSQERHAGLLTQVSPS